ncbi:MAG: hypothetical protein H0U69_00665 [Trueperaceae bacterium]|nr:hypothetical protein [Trueperaceae bacterium]
MIAGTVMALVVVLVLQVVMLWLGLTAIDPAFEADPFAGVGTGAAIGSLVTAAIALFVGGLVTGRLANRVNGADVFLHGLLTWAVVTLVTLVMTVTAAGALIGGALGVVGQGLTALGGGAAALAPAVATELEDVIEEQGMLLEDVQEEMAPLWADPAARNEFRSVVTRILRDGRTAVDPADRQELIDVVATNTELSEAEAEARVDDWIGRYEAVRERLAGAEEELRQAGQRAADAIAQAAMWAFFGLIVGAIIAALGARAGAPASRAETRRS